MPDESVGMIYERTLDLGDEFLKRAGVIRLDYQFGWLEDIKADFAKMLSTLDEWVKELMRYSAAVGAEFSKIGGGSVKASANPAEAWQKMNAQEKVRKLIPYYREMRQFNEWLKRNGEVKEGRTLAAKARNAAVNAAGTLTELKKELLKYENEI